MMTGTETLCDADPLFLTLGELVASAWMKDHEGTAEAARRLIQQEGRVRTQSGRVGTGFLWDLQRIPKDQLVRLKKSVSELKNPKKDFDIECVLRSL